MSETFVENLLDTLEVPSILEVLDWHPEERRIFKTRLEKFLSSETARKQNGFTAESWIRFALDTKDEIDRALTPEDEPYNRPSLDHPDDPVNAVIAEEAAWAVESFFIIEGHVPHESKAGTGSAVPGVAVD